MVRALALGALLAGLWAGAWAAREIGARRGPLLTWDEGGYTWKAHFAARGLRSGDAAMVWRAVAADRLNPPLNAALLGLAFLAFGASERVAFDYTAACFALCALLVWCIAWDLGGPLAASIALACLLGSRLHLEYSATLMLEVPGTALTLASIWLYLRHLRVQSASSAWWAGLGLLSVFFYKYNYGLFLVVGVLASEVSRRPFRPIGAVARGLWLPLAVAVPLWFMIPGKLDGFLDFAGNRDSRLGLMDTLSYYPGALVRYYAASPATGILIAAGALRALWLRKRDEVRFLLLFAALGLAGMTLHRYKLERSIATMVPALWLLAGVSWAELHRRIAQHRWLHIAAALTAVGVWLAPLPWLYARDLPAIARSLASGAAHPWSRFPWPGRDLLPVHDMIVRSVDPRVPIYVAGEFRELPPMALQWWFARHYPLTPVISRCFAPGTIRRPPPLDLVTIEVLAGSPYFGDDYRTYNAWALESIHEFERSGVAPAASETFAHAGVRVRVYHIPAQ